MAEERPNYVHCIQTPRQAEVDPYAEDDEDYGEEDEDHGEEEEEK